MSAVKHNIVANFAGSAWSTLISLFFLPIYIHFMGIEAYGLVGIFATLQAIFALLDLGLTTTLNRELARLTVQKNSAEKMRAIVRTLEKAYWLIAILIVIIILASASTIAQKWLNASQISSVSIEQSLIIMGGAIAFQLTANFYSGGLLGLQRQLLTNSIVITMATLRGIGAFLVLWLISPSAQAFFLWQLVVSIIQMIVSAVFLENSLPRTDTKVSFRIQLFKSTWRFAAGVSGITVLATILTQLDKIILSRLISLEMFGYYTLAGTVAMGLYRVILPVFTALYPRFTQLVSAGDVQELKNLYHAGSQLISVVTFPIAITVAFFSHEILFLWTRNSITAEQTSMLLSLLIIGTALNGCMHLPYGLQLANGWTQLTFYANLVAVLILAPVTYLVASYYGAIGTAIVWIALNCGYILIGLQIMHRRLLPTEKWKWYVEDTGKPFLAALATIGVGKWIIGTPSSPWIKAIGIISIYITSTTVSACAAPKIRSWLKSRVAQTFFIADET